MEKRVVGWTVARVRAFHEGVDAPWSEVRHLQFPGQDEGKFARFASIPEAQEYFRQGALTVGGSPAPAGKYHFQTLGNPGEEVTALLR